MTNLLALALFLAAGVVVLYHHIGYPVMLKLLARTADNDLPSFYHRFFRVTPLDHMLPRVCMVMPAHNEEHCIQDKIRNIAALD